MHTLTKYCLSTALLTSLFGFSNLSYAADNLYNLPESKDCPKPILDSSPISPDKQAVNFQWHTNGPNVFKYRLVDLASADPKVIHDSALNRAEDKTIGSKTAPFKYNLYTVCSIAGREVRSEIHQITLGGPDPSPVEPTCPARTPTGSILTKNGQKMVRLDWQYATAPIGQFKLVDAETNVTVYQEAHPFYEAPTNGKPGPFKYKLYSLCSIAGKNVISTPSEIEVKDGPIPPPEPVVCPQPQKVGDGEFSHDNTQLFFSWKTPEGSPVLSYKVFSYDNHLLYEGLNTHYNQTDLPGGTHLGPFQYFVYSICSKDGSNTSTKIEGGWNFTASSITPPSPPPPVAKNGFAIDLINNSKIATDDKVFIIAKASKSIPNQPGASAACFIRFDKTTGEGNCENVNTNPHVADYSFALASLPKIGDHKYRVYLPKVSSGRFYFSVGQSMEFSIDTNGNGAINDPEVIKSRDPNYYTLYDKFEFTHDQNGTLWINPTAVDFFSLPIALEQPSSNPGFTKVGLKESRATILNKVKQNFDQFDKRQDKPWNKLFLNYLDPDHDQTVLRLVSPGKAMTDDPNASFGFDKHYLSRPEASGGFHYVNALWDWYKTHTVKIDAFEVNPDRDHIPAANYIYTGQIPKNGYTLKVLGTQTPPDNQVEAGSVSLYATTTNQVIYAFKDEKGAVSRVEISQAELDPFGAPGHAFKQALSNKALTIPEIDVFSAIAYKKSQLEPKDTFRFTNETATDTVFVGKPMTSSPFFGGAGETLYGNNGTPRAIIARQFSAAFEPGFLPAPNGQTLNKKFFEQQLFYQDNKVWDKAPSNSGPWYDLYSKTLHSFNNQPIYTYAYDDALGQDGTIVAPPLTNGQPTVITVTLGDLTGTKILDLFKEKETEAYTVTGLPGGKNKIKYQDTDGSYKPFSTLTGKAFKQVPFKVSFCDFGGNTQYANVYFDPQMIKPNVPGADGIVISVDKTKSPMQLNLVFGGSTDLCHND